MTQQIFTADNTEGYTQAQLDALNAEFAARVAAAGVEPGSEEWHVLSSAFCDEVSRRTFLVDTRVEAGSGEDHDTGRIVEIDGDMAVVAWDSGVRTPCPMADLSAL